VLLPQHAQLLAASAIDPEVAVARGYRSVTEKVVLERYRFGRAQRRVPGLLVPVWSVWGEVALHQLRPDEPRLNKAGKPLKYETPRGARMVLDVPPGARELVDDPAKPLFVTEGIRKADAAVNQGLCCIALLGVWCWRGTNAKGGQVALPDWELIALRGRRVYLVFDSDVTVKPEVQQALTRLGQFLRTRGAEVLVCRLPSGKGGAKMGLDDFFVAGNCVDDLLATASSDPAVAAEDGEQSVEVELEPLLASAGAAVLDKVAAFIGSYVVLTNVQRDASALWTAHTHAIEAAELSPYLAVMSPEMRCGKTTLLKVLDQLVARAWRVITPSEAVLYRKIALDRPRLLLDEVETVFRRGSDTEPLRAVLNAGNERGTVVPRCTGPNRDQLEEFPIFCAKAFAGIGIDNLPGTVRDRSIEILLHRRAPDEPVRPLRRRELAEQAGPPHDLLRRWTASNLDALVEFRPLVPEELDDRAADVWEPLLALADLAGGTWPERARSAALALSGAATKEEESTSVQLLGDIKNVFDESGDDKLASNELARTLAEDEEAPWGDLRGRPLDPRGLARRLKPYRIRPKKLRFDDHTVQGYERSQFLDSWRRYLPPAEPERNNRNNGSTMRNTAAPLSGTTTEMFRTENGSNRLNQADVPDVPDTDPIQQRPSAIDPETPLPPRTSDENERLILDAVTELIADSVLLEVSDAFRWAPRPGKPVHQSDVLTIEQGRLVPNEAVCRYSDHRDSDWQTGDGPWMCGVCHPPAQTR
jgi:hypothetical protein